MGFRTTWVERDTFRYPTQFFNPMSFVTPDIKTLFEWCEFFALSDPAVQSILNKAALYPVTDILVSCKDPAIAKVVRDVFDRINIKQILITSNMHLLVYGNAFITVEEPFNRILTCNTCKKTYRFDELEKIGLSSEYGFRGFCPSCNFEVDFLHKDIYVKNIEKLKVVLWNPRFINIEAPFATAEPKYLYDVRAYLEDKLAVYKYDSLLATPLGDQPAAFEESKRYLQDIPSIFLTALRSKKHAVFNNNLLLHVSNPGMPGWSGIWGKPPLTAALRDLYFYYLVRKAFEVMLRERLIPYRFIFPRSVTGDPALEVNLARYKNELIKNLKDLEMDPNLVAMLPIPFESLNLGGESTQLFAPLVQIMSILERRIVLALGFPLEFLEGTLTWSGSSVSLRMLENLFYNQRYLFKNILNFIVRIIGLLSGFDPSIVTVDLSDLHMADDVARQRLLFDLVQQGILPESELLEEIGFNPDEVAEQAIQHEKRKGKVLRESAKIRAEAQSEAAKVEATLNPILQFRANAIIQALQHPPEEIYSLPSNVINMIYYLMQMPDSERSVILNELKQSKPGIYNLLNRFFRSQKKHKMSMESQPVEESEKPLPEQKPPRRTGEKKLI